MASNISGYFRSIPFSQESPGSPNESALSPRQRYRQLPSSGEVSDSYHHPPSDGGGQNVDETRPQAPGGFGLDIAQPSGSPPMNPAFGQTKYENLSGRGRTSDGYSLSPNPGDSEWSEKEPTQTRTRPLAVSHTKSRN